MTFTPKIRKTRHGVLAAASPTVLAAALAGAIFAPAVATAQPIELGPLRVEDMNANPLNRDTGLATLPGTIQETPQAIIVIPAEQLRQQGVTSLEQALRNVPGITVAIGEGGTLNGDQFKIRGFDAKDDVYVDGLSDFGVYTRDSFSFEEVQILKGPSGAMFGRGTTGGGVAMHALLALGYVFAAPVFTKAEGPSYVTVVSLPPEIEKPIEPKPVVPEFAPPPVYVPTAIIPEIQLTIPTPPPVITIPDKPPTAPTAPMVAPPAPPPVISGESQQAFAERLFKHLNAYKRYPASARLRHQEGVVSVRFTMDRSGRVLSFEVVKSSGAAVLDQEARDLVKRAEPLPFIPAEFWRDTLDLVVPIEFFLR